MDLTNLDSWYSNNQSILVSRPDGLWSFGTSGIETQIANLSGTTTAAVESTTGEIAFLNNDSQGQWNVWIVNAQGVQMMASNNTLTTGISSNAHLMWSHDGNVPSCRTSNQPTSFACLLGLRHLMDRDYRSEYSPRTADFRFGNGLPFANHSVFRFFCWDEIDASDLDAHSRSAWRRF